jgi:hypothetical protein
MSQDHTKPSCERCGSEDPTVAYCVVEQSPYGIEREYIEQLYCRQCRGDVPYKVIIDE